MALENFTYLNDSTNSVVNEQITIPSTNEKIYLKHDNATNINVYTGLNSTGVSLSGNITVSNDTVRSYRQYIEFDLSTRSTYGGTTAYINYTSSGDMCDDMMFQELRDEIIRLSGIVDSQSSTVTLSISSTTPADELADYQGNTAKFVANKWLKKSQTNKIKIYPTATDRTNGTNEVSGTVSMTSDDEYTWTASVSFNPSTMYYGRVFSGLQAIDGTSLTSNYDFEFQTAANQAPTLSVTVSGNTGIGSTLTASTTVGTDPDGDTVLSTAWRWLRNDVAINGATANTYQLIEADIGKTIKAEATVTMNNGTNPNPTTSSGTAIPVPTVSGVSAVAGNNQITISWTNNTSFTTETYTVKRSTTSGGTYTTVTGGSGLTGSSFIDTTAINGTTYYYKVSMTVNSVESANSSEVSGTPTTVATPTAPTIGLELIDGSFDSFKVNLLTASTGQDSYDLYIDGTLANSNVTFPYTKTGVAYGKHIVLVKAVNAGGSTNSNEGILALYPFNVANATLTGLTQYGGTSTRTLTGTKLTMTTAAAGGNYAFGFDITGKNAFDAQLSLNPNTCTQNYNVAALDWSDNLVSNRRVKISGAGASAVYEAGGTTVGSLYNLGTSETSDNIYYFRLKRGTRVATDPIEGFRSDNGTTWTTFGTNSPSTATTPLLTMLLNPNMAAPISALTGEFYWFKAVAY